MISKINDRFQIYYVEVFFYIKDDLCSARYRILSECISYAKNSGISKTKKIYNINEICAVKVCNIEGRLLRHYIIGGKKNEICRV